MSGENTLVRLSEDPPRRDNNQLRVASKQKCPVVYGHLFKNLIGILLSIYITPSPARSKRTLERCLPLDEGLQSARADRKPLSGVSIHYFFKSQQMNSMCDFFKKMKAFVLRLREDYADPAFIE